MSQRYTSPSPFCDLAIWSRVCFWVARIMCPSLHSLQLLWFAMFYAERKGGKNERMKLKMTDQLPNWEMIEQPANLFFSHFSIIFALDTVFIIKIIKGKQLWSCWLHPTIFNMHWHYKPLLTSDLGINFLGYNIFAILYLNLHCIIKPFKWH